MREDPDLQAYRAHLDVGREDLADKVFRHAHGERPVNADSDWQSEVPWPSLFIFLLLLLWYFFK